MLRLWNRFSGLVILLAAGCSAGGGANGIPTALSDIEGTAEDAYDKALVADWAAFGTDAETLTSSWSSYRSVAEADGAASTVLGAMDDAVAGVGAEAASPSGEVGAARAANAASAPMPNLFDLYTPKVPTALLALDYLGREVVLDGMETDFARASTDVDRVEAAWSGLRAEVVGAGGSQEAADYDGHVTSMRDAIGAADDSALVEQANVGLELVDAMEALF